MIDPPKEALQTCYSALKANVNRCSKNARPRAAAAIDGRFGAEDGGWIC